MIRVRSERRPGSSAGRSACRRTTTRSSGAPECYRARTATPRRRMRHCATHPTPSSRSSSRRRRRSLAGRTHAVERRQRRRTVDIGSGHHQVLVRVGKVAEPGEDGVATRSGLPAMMPSALEWHCSSALAGMPPRSSSRAGSPVPSRPPSWDPRGTRPRARADRASPRFTRLVVMMPPNENPK